MGVKPIKEIARKYKGKKYNFPIGAYAKNIETDSEHRFLTDEEKEKMLTKDDQLGESIVEFTQASKRENIKTGETLSKICGKIKKHFADLKDAAWCNTINSLNEGEDGDVTTKLALKEVDGKMGGMVLKRTGSDIYVEYQDGADTVRKKLGSRKVTDLPLNLLISGNDQQAITAGPIDFTDCSFLKLVYDYTTSNRESLHIDIYNGDTVYLQKYLAKGYSKGKLTLQQNLESVIDVETVSGEHYIRLWADDDPDSGGGMDGLGNFVVKSMVLYGT